MSKLLQSGLLQVKMDIRNRYLAGDSIPTIAKAFNVSDRNIYYHLKPLTAEEKGIHTKNASLKMTKRKEDAKNEHQEVSTGIQGAGTAQGGKSTGKASSSSLADFE